MRSLASRITIVSVVLVSLAVAIAIGGTWVMSNRIASQAVTDSLAASQATQRYLQSSRARELALMTDLLAADPHDTAYLVEATRGQIDAGEEIDLHSILDLIDDRRSEMGFDFAMMLDPDGEVLVRTDRPEVSRQALADHPLVAPVLEELIPEYGPWREGGQLYSAAVVPVTTAFELVGFLISGLAIDDEVASDIKRVTGVDMTFLALRDGRPSMAASTLDLRQGESLLDQLAGGGDAIERLAAGQPVDRIDVVIDGENWVARAEPIIDGNGQVLGAVLTVDSLDARLAGQRTLQTALVIGGVLAILIALALSLLVARRIARPVTALAGVADEAAQGDYDQAIDVSGKDEVGTLARAISRLLSDLREQQEIAGYVSDLSQHLDEAGNEPATETAPTQIGETRSGSAWILAIEWFSEDADPPDTLVRQVEQWLPRLASLAGQARAGLVTSGTTRVFLTVEQAETESLLRLLGWVLNLAGQGEHPPALALAVGEISSASLTVAHSHSRLVSGKPLRQCEGLLREAGPGRLLLSATAFKALQPSLESAGAQTRVATGQSGKRRFYQLAEVPADADQTASIPVMDEASSPSSIGIGRVLGDRFEIVELLGEGAMGSVYKARDRKLGDVVALKLLKPGMVSDPDYLERMKSEIRLARRITHPNVLRTHDFFEFDNLPVISMAYVRGITLSQLLKRTSRLTLAAGLRVSTQVLQGLEAAHRAEVLHRDIKPANIILDQRGNAQLMDFGIARQVIGDASDITQPGTIVGTASYMAPELLLGKQADRRSDIYSMGVMMNEMFTGKLPFEGETSMEVCMAHIQKKPEAPSKFWPEILPELEAIILKCLAKNPDERFDSAEALLTRLVGVRRQSSGRTGRGN